MEKGGKKLAVLVGCNYENTKYRLHGCHNDVLAMREVLVNRFGFDSQHIELLMDKSGSPVMPTGANIKKALNKMVDEAEAGDVLYFHFSGHGTLTGKKNQQEAIIPLDFNYITNLDIRKIVNRVPEGATFTILSDSCHSGGLIDKAKEQIGPSHHNSKNQEDGKNNNYASVPDRSRSSLRSHHKPKFIPHETVLEHLTSLTNTNTLEIGTHMLQLFGNEASVLFSLPQMELDLLKPLKQDEGILLSGCQSNETCEDVGGGEGENEEKSYGAFSHAILIVLEKHLGPLSNKELVLRSRDVLENDEHIVTQHPCLYCSDENAQASFLEPRMRSNAIIM